MYLQFLRKAVPLVEKTHRLPRRTSPRKTAGNKRRLMEDTDSEEEVAANTFQEGLLGDTEDVVTAEVRRWKDLPREIHNKFRDDDDFINEMHMM